MAEVVKFKKEHLFAINEHVHDFSVKTIPVASLERLEARDYNYCILEGERVLAVCGCIPKGLNRGEVWCVLDKELKDVFFKVHNLIKPLIEGLPYERIEAVVNCDFEQGKRWMQVLGFTLEAPLMRKYSRTGKDCALYAKVRE